MLSDKSSIVVISVGVFVLLLGTVFATTITPQPLSKTEISTLQQEEDESLQVTEWGDYVKNMEQFQKNVQEPQPLGTTEITFLMKQTDGETLGNFVGLGERNTWRCILLFIPDRILDALDMVSGGVAVLGVGVGAEVHVTRYASLGAGAQAMVLPNLFWYYNRNLMTTAYATGVIASGGPYQDYILKFFGVGTGMDKGRPGAGRKVFRKAGMFSKQDKMCQEGWMDPWGIGFGWALELHPVEIADFFAGLFTVGFVDISRDDYANPNRTRYKIGTPVEYPLEHGDTE